MTQMSPTALAIGNTAAIIRENTQISLVLFCIKNSSVLGGVFKS